MACKSCKKSVFKAKLGRCNFCMWMNFLLLMISAIGCFITYQQGLRQVQSIALLFTFIISAVLMSLHIVAYLYYRFKGIRYPTQDAQ